MKTPLKLNRMLTLSLAFIFCLLAVHSVLAATDTWTGGISPNGNWSAGGNWLSGNTPLAFDSLVFTNQTGAAALPNDDFAAGTAFDGITFGSSSAGSTLSLTGNSILLSGGTNGNTVGINNTSGLAETVSNNLVLDWGNYTFSSSAGSLSLDGTLMPNNLAGVAVFNSGTVTSGSFAVDGTGLIAGLGGAGLFGSTGTDGGYISLATINGGGTVSAYAYSGSSIITAAGAIGATNQASATNLELTATVAGSYTLNGGTSTTYGTSDTFINTILATESSSVKLTVGSTDSGTIVMGATNIGTGMYVGGFYFPSAQSSQELTVGAGTTSFLTAGPMTGNPVPGEIIFAINGTSTSNEGELDATTKDNLSGGKVTVVKTGTGSMYFAAANTYSGGTYIDQGYLQVNNNGSLGSGPVYIASGATLYLNNGATGSWSNNISISPGVGNLYVGAIKITGGTNTGSITLLGAPVTSVPGDRIAPSGNGNVFTFLGQITGPGTLEFYADAATITSVLTNIGTANNWTGGMIIDGANNDSSDVKLEANNQLAGNNVTLIQAGTGFARLDLNGYNDAIGGLNSSGTSTLNEMANFSGVSPSILTLGANNASGSFTGVIGGDSAPNTLSLVKLGTGTQTLSGANTYLGNTLVEGGTLALVGGGSLAGSPSITVNNATFDVSAVSADTDPCGIGMANSTFNLGSVVATAVSSLAITNSTLIFSLNQNAANITVSGALTAAGTTNLIDLTELLGFATYPQQIHLIKYQSFANVDGNNDLTNFSLIFPPQGNFSAYLTNNVGNGSIDLVVASGPSIPVVPITWNGETNGVPVGNWDIFATSNWVVTASSSTPYVYQDTSPVTFDDSLLGTTTVNLTRTVFPGSITFNNVNSNYVFSGTGKISGTTSLTENGTGKVTLSESGSDNFSGGITINNGTVVLDNNNAISGGLTINAGTAQLGNNDAKGNLPSGTLTDDGVLAFDRSDNALTNAVVIGGSGSVVNSGSGTVTLSAVETYTGSTTANAGTLAFNGPNVNPSGISTSSGLTINSNATVLVDSDNAFEGSTGVVPVSINAGGTLTGLGSADGNDGTSSHLGGLLTLNGGTLALQGPETAIQTHGSWDLGGGVTVPGGTVTATISALGVVPDQGGGTIFNVTNGTTSSGIDLLVSGSLVNVSAAADTGIIKNGPGTMVLDNTNTYAAGTTVTGGTLQLGRTSDSTNILTLTAVGSGTVSLSSGAILYLDSSRGITIPNVISDDGTATLLMSSGTNTLESANTYSGKTIVETGKLALIGGGAINSSVAITVSNATFDVSASSNAVASSGSLSLTSSTFNLGTNEVTSLGSLAISNSTLAFSPNAPGTPTGTITPSINNLGALTMGGTTNVINLTAVPGYLTYPADVTLIKYTTAAGITNANNNLTALGLILPALGAPTGYLTNNAANSSIDLVLLSDTNVPVFAVTWSGRTNGVNIGNWDFTTRDWVYTSDGVTPYVYQNPAAVTFDDTAAGTTSINLAATVSPGSLTFNNNSKTYAFSGPGKISGNTGLNMTQAGTVTLAETGGDNFSGSITMGSQGNTGGTLILSNANVSLNGGLTVNSGSLIDEHPSGTISGGVTVNGGLAVLDEAGSIAGNLIINNEGYPSTAQVGNNDASGNLPSGTITDGGTLIFDRSDSALNVGAVIAGSGTLENNGTGTVTLSAIETYTGPTIVNGGTLAVLESANASPDGISSSSSLTINTNGTFMFESDNAALGTGTAGLPVTVNAGGTLTGLSSADGGDGTSSHIPGLLTLNGGTLGMQGPPIAALPSHGSWDLYGGVTVNSGPNYGVTSVISALGVIPTQSGGTVFDVTAGGTPSGIDLLVTGSFIDGTSGGVFVGSGIILEGNGVMALDNGSNTYLGGTIINSGTLQLGTASDTNALAEPLGAGTVTINNAGSTLDFASSQGVTVNNTIADDGTGTLLVNSGTNILTAANTYSGNTIVNGGKLALSGVGSINSSAAITVSNATLDVSASATAVASTGSLSLTSSTFNLGPNLVAALNNLSLSNATLIFPANTNTPNISLTGALTTGGTTNVINITSVPALSVFPTNITLIKYTTAGAGLINGNNTPTTLGVKLPGVGYLTNNIGNSSIDLIVISVTPPVNTNAATADFHATAVNGSLDFSWAPDHQGWQLYTNAVGLLSTNSWFPVTGSASVTNETITINPANANVFFQLRYP